MSRSVYIKTALLLALAGVLFAGYLTGVKLLTNQCAFNEPCPSFLGYPACWYGLAMFLLMLIAGLIGWCRVSLIRGVMKWNLAVSLLGMLFAGRFVWLEVRSWTHGLPGYALKLPTCVYGLIVYAVIFAVSWIALASRSDI